MVSAHAWPRLIIGVYKPCYNAQVPEEKVIRRFVLRYVARARQEMTEQAQCYLNRLGDRD